MKTEELLKQLTIYINDVRDPNLKEDMTNLLIDLTLMVYEGNPRVTTCLKNYGLSLNDLKKLNITEPEIDKIIEKLNKKL